MNKLNYILGMILLCISPALKAQNLEAVVDTTQIRIGEQITYSIVLDKTTNSVIFPEQLELFGLEVVAQSSIDTFKNKVIKQYLITGFDSGSYYIPAQQLLVNNQRYLTDSIKIDVATVAVDTLENPMFPVKSIAAEPYIYDDFRPYVNAGLLILLAIIALYFVYTYFKANKKEAVEMAPAIPPYQLAKQRLDELDPEALEAKEFYVELTDILRTYIEDEYLIPAKESTTDELIEYLKDVQTLNRLDLTNDLIKQVKGLLMDADLVKFAKMTPTENQLKQDQKLTAFLVDEFKAVGKEEDQNV
ncbi:BatD family protein [Flavobacteriaceae bacterium]|nr:BatD family protein [Flavobacteriaceae bacterium]